MELFKKNTTSLINKFRKNSGGNVAIVFALALIPVMFAVGMSVDYSDIQRTKSRLQETSDSAALYAIKGLKDGGYDEDQLDSLANDMVLSNYDIDTSEVIIVLDTEADTLSVSLNTDYIPSFLKVFGINNVKLTAYTKVKYEIENSTAKCIMALDGTADDALNLVGNVGIDATSCAVYVNSSSNDAIDLDGNTEIDAAKVCVVGGVSSGAGNISPSAKTCPAISDPFANNALPTVGSCDYNNKSVKNTVTLNPGVYCGGLSTTGNANVTLNPGLYIIKDGAFKTSGNTVIQGDSVTFFFTGDDVELDSSGNTTFNLTAMSSGELASFVFYFDPASDLSATTSKLSGNAATYFEGIMYFGAQDVQISGNGNINTTSPFSVLAADIISLNGNASITFNVDEDSTDLDVPDELYTRSVLATIIK